MKKFSLILIFSSVFLSVFGQASIYPSKVALLIGNDKYSSIDTLKTTEAEALAVAETLHKLGFDTILCLSANKEQMYASIDRFLSKIENGGVAIFYYSGHGLQYKSESYLVPVDFKLNESEHIPNQCISINEVLQKMDNKKSHLNLLVIDACRNELPKAIGATSGTISLYNENTQTGAHNLSSMYLKSTNNTIVAFATHAGFVAFESQYTPKLIECLNERNNHVLLVFNCVHSKFTHKTQRPIVSSSYGGVFCFSGSVGGFNPLNVLCLEINEDMFGQKSSIFERTFKSEMTKANYSFFVDKEMAEYTLLIDVKSVDGGNYKGRTFTAYTDVYIEITDKNGNVLKSYQIEDDDRTETKKVSTRSYETAADLSFKAAAPIVAQRIINILK